MIFRSTISRLSVSALLAFAALACGRAQPMGGSPEIDAAVTRLGDGSIIRSYDNRVHELSNNGEKAVSSVPAVILPPIPASDPCPEVASPPSTMSDAVFASTLSSLGACFRARLEAPRLAHDAFEYLRNFVLDDGAPALNTLTDAELSEFLKSHAADPVRLYGTGSPQLLTLRDRFTDSDLDDLEKLAARRLKALSIAEGEILAVAAARVPLLTRASAKSNRYALLLTLGQTANDAKGDATATAIGNVLRASQLSVPADAARFKRLHPYAIQAVATAPGHEADALNAAENPFELVAEAEAELGGEEDDVSDARSRYAQFRGRDNPTMPQHPAPAPDAVHVAFIDTGIDFVAFPDLGLFLGSGTGGSIASGDFADGDSNPWLPAVDEFAHGSGTVATLLTILAHYAPDTLQNRRVDLAMWKVNTIRSLLGGRYPELTSWGSRVSVQDAVLSRISEPGVKPKIVSVSMDFALQFLLDQLHQPDALKQAPWLWVMSAGNFSQDVSKEASPSCFSDVPKEHRVDSRTLCVGALEQGIVNDKIAAYSNFGDRVEVYAYERYIGLCPGGTSCSTPAVSAAAAAIAAKYPSLSPENIKQAIVGAAETRTLDVDYGRGDPTAASTQRRTVKVFDPASMLKRALELAGKM